MFLVSKTGHIFLICKLLHEYFVKFMQIRNIVPILVTSLPIENFINQ
jgi:hypothetical protein